MTARSYLYVPGDRADRLASALRREADGIIIDLEDAVPADRKLAAREIALDWLAGARWSGELWVRVNPGPLREADVRAFAGRPVTGFCLAKTLDRAEVEAIAMMLDVAGSFAALAPVLETPAAVLGAREIAAAPRVRRLQIGEADLRAELGIEPSTDDRELLHLRSHVVLCSAAAGIEAPLAPASTNFGDLIAYEASTRALRRLGFFGRACIHPTQVPITNEVFTPTDDEIASAKRLIGALSAGAVVANEGSLIDEAVVRQARRVLALAARLST